MADTSTYKATLGDTFESQFADLHDASVAPEVLIALAARLQNKRKELPPELVANENVKIILDAGLPEVHNTFIGLDAIAKMTPKNFLPSNGVEALLTPSRDLGNGVSARQHAVSGEIFLFPSRIPHRIFTQPYDEMPQVLEVSPAQEGLEKFSRVRIS